MTILKEWLSRPKQRKEKMKNALIIVTLALALIGCKTVETPTTGIDSVKVDSVKVDSTKKDTTKVSKVDSVKTDSTKAVKK